MRFARTEITPLARGLDMLLTDELVHTASISVAADAAALFSYIADGRRLGEWTFGSWGTRPLAEDVVVGRSLFDGNETYVRVVPYASMLQVDFEVGSDPEQLLPRITARILRAELAGLPDGHCLLTMISWRATGIPDERWRLICCAHEAEVFRLRQAFLEASSVHV